jgi:hypothetical protein
VESLPTYQLFLLVEQSTVFTQAVAPLPPPFCVNVEGELKRPHTRLNRSTYTSTRAIPATVRSVLSCLFKRFTLLLAAQILSLSSALFSPIGESVVCSSDSAEEKDEAGWGASLFCIQCQQR